MRIDAVSLSGPGHFISMGALAFWVPACMVAVAAGASLSYFTLGAGAPRLVLDGLIVGLLQGLVLRRLVRVRYWVSLTIIGMGLAVVAGVVTVVAAGLLLAPIGNDSQVYVVLTYSIGAASAGLTAGLIQGGALPPQRRLLPWLVGSACGAPFLFPAVLFSWSPSGAVSAPLPAWIVGLLGGLVYGVISGVGLLRALRLQV